LQYTLEPNVFNAMVAVQSGHSPTSLENSINMYYGNQILQVLHSNNQKNKLNTSTGQEKSYSTEKHAW